MMNLLDLPTELLYGAFDHTTPLQISGFACASERALEAVNSYLKDDSPTGDYKSQTGRYIGAFREQDLCVQESILRTQHILPFPDVFQLMTDDLANLYKCTMLVCKTASEIPDDNVGEYAMVYDRFIQQIEDANDAAKKANFSEPDFRAEWIAVAGKSKSIASTCIQDELYAKFQLYVCLARKAAGKAGLRDAEFEAEVQMMSTIMVERVRLSAAKCASDGDHEQFKRQARWLGNVTARVGLPEPDLGREEQMCWTAAAGNLRSFAANYKGKDDHDKFYFLVAEADAAAETAGIPQPECMVELQESWKVVTRKLWKLVSQYRRQGVHSMLKVYEDLAKEATKEAGLEMLHGTESM